MQAIIIAGGKGTRLRPLADTTPKLLLKLKNKPLLDYIIDLLKKNDCDNIIICTRHLSEKIEEHVKKNNSDIPIRLSKENKPLGTAGALYLIKDMLEDEFLILYGDVYTTINLRKMFEFHKKKKAVVTAAIHRSEHPKDSNLVEFNSDARITKILLKPHSEIPTKPYNLAALYVVSRDIIKHLTPETPYDFEYDLLPKLLDENMPIYAYHTSEFIMDIGTPERLEKAGKILK